MEAGDQQLVHTTLVPLGYWGPCAPLVWNPVKAPYIRFSSSHFRKQHLLREGRFDEHIINTKELLSNILKMEDELHRRLTDLATNVNDLHDQAKKELLTAQYLRNQTNEIEKILNGIEKRVSLFCVYFKLIYLYMTDVIYCLVP
ncbi:unnamed protein product [Schistosoma margrebowiei]|uniref:Uncharacterized protein n=1 Tax=Schistosoma margrebowiei TaxID=48269 RepID=A0A183LQX6_9TREM|nr:unnamed protein product [Schistosoma margrebowiei]